MKKMFCCFIFSLKKLPNYKVLYIKLITNNLPLIHRDSQNQFSQQYAWS